MAEDLEAEDRYRRELIGNVSHELRTPIAALQAVLENVVDGVAVADRSTMMSALAQTSDWAAWSRICWICPGSREVRFRCGEPLSRSSRSGRGDRAGVGSRPVAAGGRGRRPAGLRAVADNAATASGDHESRRQRGTARIAGSPVRIRIRVRADPHSGDLILDVHDDGPGIPDADRSRVFERFARGGAQDGGTDSGSRSPAGPWNCTTAGSKFSTRPAAAASEWHCRRARPAHDRHPFGTGPSRSAPR
ncbi:hypothetical protein GS539_21330 [Rhodococcus hoagii]|nr:hypothetical protein [Prescottella equi]